MNKLDEFERRTLASLKELGVNSTRAEHIVRMLMIRLRRELGQTPLTRPRILIEDRLVEGRGILLVVGKPSNGYDPHTLLEDYIAEQGYKQTFKIEPAFHPNSNVDAWQAVPTSPPQTRAQAAKKEKTILSSFAKLSPEQQEAALLEIQKRIKKP